MARGPLTRRAGIGLTLCVRTILMQLLGRAVVLGAIALVAVGVSGGVAAAFGATAGASFVAGDPPGVHYSAARCADFREYAPHATSCEAAATEHHFTEVVRYRLAAGVAGLVLLGACLLVRRRIPGLFRSDRLPVAFDETIAAALFGAAGIWLLGYGVDRAALGYHGSGFFLSGACVALAIAAIAGMRFLRRLVPTAGL